MHMKINPELTFPQAAALPRFQFNEHTTELYQMMLIGLMGPLFADEMNFDVDYDDRGVWSQDVVVDPLG